MTTFDSFLEESLKDPELRAEYDALEPEFTITQPGHGKDDTDADCEIVQTASAQFDIGRA